jgi:hypothetical protein
MRRRALRLNRNPTGRIGRIAATITGRRPRSGRSVVENNGWERYFPPIIADSKRTALGGPLLM